MIYLSAGHSEVDPGACAFNRREADIAVEFRNIVSFYLTQHGVKHDVDGKGTTNIPLGIAARQMRAHSVGVEFHCNASEDVRATGCEVLCAPKDNVRAAAICKAISSTLGIINRGVKPENAGQHRRLAFVQAGGMIVELFFLSNPKDLAAYDARKWVAAHAVADAMIAP